MTQSTERLEILKLIVQIAATIAVPTIIAVFGTQVQETLSNRELGKSYVEMALDILKRPPTKENADLRKWAIAIVDKNSPVPLTAKLREQLSTSTALAAATPSALPAPDSSQQSYSHEEDIAPEIKVLPAGGIVRFVKCRKAKDKETVDWLLKNYAGFFKCAKKDEVGRYAFAIKGSTEDPGARYHVPFMPRVYHGPSQ